MTKHIGKLIKASREKRKMSVPALAVLCNVTRGRIYQWEKQRFILPKQLPLLAAALLIRLTELEYENGKDNRKFGNDRRTGND